MTNYFNASKTHRRQQNTPDDRARAANCLKGFLSCQDYLPPDVVRDLKVLIPELRGREEETD